MDVVLQFKHQSNVRQQTWDPNVEAISPPQQALVEVRCYDQNLEDKRVKFRSAEF